MVSIGFFFREKVHLDVAQFDRNGGTPIIDLRIEKLELPFSGGHGREHEPKIGWVKRLRHKIAVIFLASKLLWIGRIEQSPALSLRKQRKLGAIL